LEPKGAAFVCRATTQSAKKPDYNGPFDAMRKIYGAHGIQGIFKGQVRFTVFPLSPCSLTPGVP
jgi:hypothetical protein